MYPVILRPRSIFLLCSASQSAVTWAGGNIHRSATESKTGSEHDFRAAPPLAQESPEKRGFGWSSASALL